VREVRVEGLSPVDEATLANGYEALRGSGGGMKVLEENEHPHTAAALYRPWDTRFDLQPYDIGSPAFMKPENRIGYRKFFASHPYPALVPNSRDRNAESSVVLAFGLTAFAAVIGAVLIVYDQQVLNADDLELGDYRRKMLKVVILASMPWILLFFWLLCTFATFLFRPMRFPESVYHWQCGAMVWFLFVAPLINSAYFIVNALWIGKIFYCIDKQAPMGRMFKISKELQKDDGGCWIMDYAISASSRYLLFSIEVISAIWGYLLISFRWGANSQYCQPEVYWGTTALVFSAAIIVVFSALACSCSIFLRVCTTSRWMQDFADSFYEGGLHAKAKAMEKKEAKVRVEDMARAKAKEKEDEFAAWYDEQLQAVQTEGKIPTQVMTTPTILQSRYPVPISASNVLTTAPLSTMHGVANVQSPWGSQGFPSPFAQTSAPRSQPVFFNSDRTLSTSRSTPLAMQAVPSMQSAAVGTIPFQPVASGSFPIVTAPVSGTQRLVSTSVVGTQRLG